MEQMGPLNYKIRGRGKVQIVNVRRLIKYDPFLLEDESVEEALKRMKEDFQEVPPIQKDDTLEEENAYRAPVTEKEETEEESKEDSNRKSAAGTQSKAPIVRGAGTGPLAQQGLAGRPFVFWANYFLPAERQQWDRQAKWKARRQDKQAKGNAARQAGKSALLSAVVPGQAVRCAGADCVASTMRHYA
eukprot:g16616.t1